MKKRFTMILNLRKISILFAFLCVFGIANGQLNTKFELTYEGTSISDASQTSGFASEVTPTQSGGSLMLDVQSLPDGDTVYMVELTEVVDISGDPNIFAKIGSDTQMKYMGVILEDINGNHTQGNTGTDQFFLPGIADTSYFFSFSAGSNAQASAQKELDANNVDATQIKKLLFVNHSGADYSGQIWFESLQLGSDATDNGVVRTDTTFSAPFDGKRMFGNGLAGIAMDSWAKIGIVQDEVLNISVNERLGEHSYMTVFIFDPLLDLSGGNAVFDLEMKASTDIQLLFRFEDVNGQRVDLVDVSPAVSDDLHSYHFDVNHRLSSNPDFDPSQIKEFHIRKISTEGVNGTVVIDNLNLGLPYFNQYENSFEGTEISNMIQTSTFAPEVTASQSNGILEIDITGLADQDTFYMIEFDRPLDISEDPNIWAVIKSDAEMEFMGVRLVDLEGNYTLGTTKYEKMHLPGVDKFLNYSFSDGSNNQMGAQTPLTNNNVDSTSIKKLIFFNNSGAAFTGKIWFEHLRLCTEDTDNGVVLTDTTFYNPFDGERTFGNGLKALAMDNNGQIGVGQDEVLHVSMMERLSEHSYLTVFIFEDTLDLSRGNSNVMFKIKSDIEVDLLLRYEDYNGERVDLHNFITEVSDTFVTYAFDLNHRFLSNPGFKPDQIKEFHFRKLSTGPFNGNLVIDEFQLGFADTEAPDAPANLKITEATDTTATLEWEKPSDNYEVFSYNIYLNGELHDKAFGPNIKLFELNGTLTFTVTAVDRSGNESEMSNEVTETFTATNIEKNISGEDINIYPNPITSYVNVNSKFDINRIEIYSISGVLSKVYQSDGDRTKVVNLSTETLDKGVYLMNIQTEKGAFVKKLIKE